MSSFSCTRHLLGFSDLLGSSVVNVEMLGEAPGVIITQQLVVGIVVVFRSVVAPIPIILLHLGWLVDIKPTRSFPTMPFLKETPSFLQYLMEWVLPHVSGCEWFVVGEHHGVVLRVRFVTSFLVPLLIVPLLIPCHRTVKSPCQINVK